jgi:hypothetical protein
MIRQYEQQNSKDSRKGSCADAPDRKPSAGSGVGTLCVSCSDLHCLSVLIPKSKIRKSKRDYILKGEVEARDWDDGIRGAGMEEARAVDYW